MTETTSSPLFLWVVLSALALVLGFVVWSVVAKLKFGSADARKPATCVTCGEDVDGQDQYCGACGAELR